MQLQKTLAFQLLKITFSIYLLITVSITSISMYAKWVQTEKFLQEDLSELSRSANKGITLAVWDIDYVQVDRIAEGLLDLPIVVGIAIKDQKIDKLYGLRGNIEEKHELVHEEEAGVIYHVGSMTVYSSSSIVFDRVKNDYLLTVISAIVKTLALWLIILLVGKKLITGPLKILITVNQKMDLNNLEDFKKINVGMHHRENELSLLESSFNTMVEKLITARHELNQVNQNLEYKVEQRTHELQDTLEELGAQHRQLQTTQTQLIQSEKMASLGTLVAGVAHEMNNPTSFVYATTHNLKNNLSELKQFIFHLAGEDADATFTRMFEERFERLGRNLSNISEGSNRIKDIVRDLRTFSRLDEMERKHVNVVDGVRSTLRLIQTQYKKEVEFIEDFQGMPEVIGWPAELNQVYMNIIVNACQAIVAKQKQTNNKAPGKLWIRTFDWGETENQQVGIQFEDTGCGMSQEVLSQIFDPFFTTKETGQGTGLGMSISYGIVEKHKGAITVHSEEGEGSTVTLLLPKN